MSWLNGSAGPLCPAGRCSALLRGLAEAQTVEKLSDRYGAQLADVIRGVLGEFGIDPSRPEVAAVVAREIRRVTGVGSV